MQEQNTPLPWERLGWQQQVNAWIEAQLACRKIRLNGAVEPFKVRFWSAVLRAPASGGDFYFKMPAPVAAHEPALVQTLSRWRPDCLPQVTAIDRRRGWMLMPDGGRPMRTLTLAERNISRWRKVLPLYANLQIEMAGRAQELLALGVYDRRLAVMPELFGQLLDDRDAARVGRPGELTSGEYERLRKLKPQFSALCRELASYGLPETLDHSDLHDNNILVRPSKNRGQGASYIFFDWGDSCLTHPFVSLFVTLRSVAFHLELADDAPELAELRDLYLAQWTRFGTAKELLAAFGLAMQVAMIIRALTINHFLPAASGSGKEEFASAISESLKEFLEIMERSNPATS